MQPDCVTVAGVTVREYVCSGEIAANFKAIRILPRKKGE